MKHSQHINPNDANRIDGLIRRVPDFPKPGILFMDVTPVWADSKALGVLASALCAPYMWGTKPTAIVGIEARGFLVGMMMARYLGVGFVPVRKPGKLPGKVDSVSYGLEYGDATLQLQEGTFKPGDGVVIVDDLLATGGTAEAAATLVERQGATVMSFEFIVELEALEGTRRLRLPSRSLFTY